MAALEHLEIHNGWGIYRPRGQFSLVDAVDLVTRAIAHCRESEANKLLVDATGFIDLPIPTLLDRFLMVEDWAQEARSVVVVAMAGTSMACAHAFASAARCCRYRHPAAGTH